MAYFMILFGVIFVILLFILLKKEKQLKDCMQQLKEIQIQLQKSQDEIEKFQNKSQKLWDFSNTIHLYASLSEEDAKNEALKQKQLEIIKLSQDMINILENKEDGDF